MELLNLLLMSPPSGGSDGGGMGNLFFLGAIILVFYFFMIRPQSKKMKDQKQFKESIEKGARIVTIGGLHGKIIGVSDKYFMIESEGNVKLKIDRTAISMEMTKALDEQKS